MVLSTLHWISVKGNNMEKIMEKPITLTYEFDGEVKVYTATTYDDWHRVVRILHENENHYKVISVTR